MDATILVTEPLENHKDLIESTYFTQRFAQNKHHYNPFSYHVTYGRWAGFLQSTNLLHNPLFVFAKDFLNEYWRDYDELVEFYLVDFTINLAYENIEFVKKELDAVPINNTDIYTIQNSLDMPYKNFPYEEILKKTYFYKLSNKQKFDDKKENTVFKEIQRRYAPETL